MLATLGNYRSQSCNPMFDRCVPFAMVEAVVRIVPFSMALLLLTIKAPAADLTFTGNLRFVSASTITVRHFEASADITFK